MNANASHDAHKRYKKDYWQSTIWRILENHVKPSHITCLKRKVWTFLAVTKFPKPRARARLPQRYKQAIGSESHITPPLRFRFKKVCVNYVYIYSWPYGTLTLLEATPICWRMRNKTEYINWINLATHVACLIWPRTLKCGIALNLLKLNCSAKVGEKDAPTFLNVSEQW